MMITQAYVAGQVQRWHQNPTMAATGQTLADHQGRCVQLLLMLNPEASPALIRAVAFHDVGELVAGDLSRPLKQAQPTLATRHAGFETQAREAIAGPDPVLTETEAAWLKLIDFLECAAYTLLTRPWEAERKASGWKVAILRLGVMADVLGCGPAVRGFIADLREGNW